MLQIVHLAIAVGRESDDQINVVERPRVYQELAVERPHDRGVRVEGDKDGAHPIAPTARGATEDLRAGRIQLQPGPDTPAR